MVGSDSGRSDGGDCSTGWTDDSTSLRGRCLCGHNGRVDAAALESFLADLPGAGASFPFGPEIRVWKVEGKVFALESERFGRPVVSVKALPENVVHLVAGVDGIEPGYHLNKKHWVTVDAGGRVEEGLVQELLAESHAIIVAKLPRRLRLALDGTATGSLSEDA
ncbi:MmcQ/YjbR family DNA-binding protein [Rathayibacter sp. VKM Ac-2857]|nr:MmcQ/YjbR family DNA-binding protein [Rathayibacter sp. VKM Ac-2857]NQX16980.1 MmcQ/YjbR family DNA-binding protein [Rathayibacter sp. VKM Ac-2857]